MNRRQALRTLSIGGATLLVSPTIGCTNPFRTISKAIGRAGNDNWLAEFSPIDRTVVHNSAFKLTGDEPSKAHGILWNKEKFLAENPLPEPTERVRVAVVGGGMSGLMSAYLLKKHNPVVLEVSPRFGGNSRGESWEGIDYSIGAAYFMEQEKGSAIHSLFSEVGAFDGARFKKEDDPVALLGKMYLNFWEGETDPNAAKQFRKVGEHLRAMYEGKIQFPDIPVASAAGRKYVDEIDRESFGAYLRRICGGPLHPHVESFVEYYSWSSLGGSMDEISAASGLCSLAFEPGGAYVTPGGNAGVAEKFLRKTLDVVRKENFRANSLVFDVRSERDGVRVTWIDQAGAVNALHADAVVMACPKFVVKRVLEGIEPERKAAIESIRYRSYLVANVFLNGGISRDFYDLYLIDSQVSKVKKGSKATDVILANYARPRSDRTVLTLYRSLPYDGARGEMYNGDFSKFRSEFEAQIKKEILPLFGKTWSDVKGLRVNRWGHPIPVARRGQIRAGIPDAVFAPFGKKVFFVEQDNWMFPAIETCALEALKWAPEVEKVLRG